MVPISDAFCIWETLASLNTLIFSSAKCILDSDKLELSSYSDAVSVLYLFEYCVCLPSIHESRVSLRQYKGPKALAFLKGSERLF